MPGGETVTSSSVVTAAAVAATAVGLLSASRLVRRWRRSRHLSALRSRLQAAYREAKTRFGEHINEEVRRQQLTDSEKSEILSLSTGELLSRLRAKSLDPARVLLAYQARAYEVDRDLNCVIEFLQPDLAEVNLDGPLAGLPISIKESMAVKGKYSCFGLAAFAEKPLPTEDCSTVKILRALGGVPFVRTSVPQTMMSVLSHNPIEGAVKHPTAENRSPGGSSSGEAALIAAGGSPLGLGSDIGGSIRLPAAWCGIAGFKPTSGRLSRQGQRSVSVQKLVPASWGPMGPDVASLATFMKAFCNSELHDQIDPGVPPLGFNETIYVESRPLRIGFYLYDHQFQAVPSAERAVKETVDRLASRGHTMVPWDPPIRRLNLMETYLRAVTCDGAGILDDALNGDRVSYAVKLGLHAIQVPWPGRWVRQRWCRLTGDSETEEWLRSSVPMPNVLSMWYFNQEVTSLREEFTHRWREDKLDAIICPALGCPAVDLEPKSPFNGCLSYLVLYNLFNFPAGSVPVTRVTASDVAAMSNYPLAARMQAGSEGLPVSVQCAALPWRDEACLSLMREVEAAWRDK
uniref:Amidase domain-containing protein n=1 Tax=Macrostomum lignano TaxID=282301 RepID=A0A1I8JIR8_9PLAT